MKLKRIGALLLGFCLFATNASFAISENNLKSKFKKNKTEINKLEYINLDFWNSYNDMNLKYFILRAMEQNHDLKIAAKNAEIYYQNVSLERSNQFPTIGAGVSPGLSKASGKNSFDWSFFAPLYVSYEADVFLKNRDKTRLAKNDYEISLLDERAAYISVASMVGTLYFNILKTEKAIELQEEIVDLRKETHRIMSLSNQVGLLSTQDVIQANKSYLAGSAELINLKKQKMKLLNTFAVLIGVKPKLVNDFQFSDIEEIDYTGYMPNEVPSALITKRPDYIKAEKSVERAGLDVRIAKKEFLPTISISGLSFFSADNLGSLLTTKNAALGLTGTLIADLFTGGKKMSNLKIKKSQYEITLQEYEKTNLTAIQEVNDALVAIKYDKEKYAEDEKQNKLEMTDYGIREMKFHEGVISKLDLIQAKENLLVTKKLLLADKADCYIDYIGLYKALGGGLDNPFKSNI